MYVMYQHKIKHLGSIPLQVQHINRMYVALLGSRSNATNFHKRNTACNEERAVQGGRCNTPHFLLDNRLNAEP